ncbi:ribonuclease D [Rufibacter glacialis]|uniref:Ribonuclease D n=1 Tax=Rufibacter glacialis TaxID=1259555 RepID=A0A5M8Q8E8_9BACT|nr:ribonuclease D [Rufibacter glacialis]KAA6431100.1 ribonuclease D [Rufibacter glacialis]GGK84019.1 ribonuclease D [Rufibacter glacialis]
MKEPAFTLEGKPVHVVQTDEALQEAVAHLSQRPELALDLEFDQHHYTYGFTLCLIQISDGHTCFIIDPFPLSDLQGLWDVLENPAILKIFHHANNDLMLLSMLGCQVRHLVDTAVAAKILNYAKAALGTLLEEELGLRLDKSQQMSNWNQRPLSKRQLEYAAQDVLYLHELKNAMVSKIQEMGRLAWLQEEDQLLESITYAEQEDPHLKIKFPQRLTLLQQFILKPIYDFRDQLAQKWNLPAGQVINTNALMQLLSNPEQPINEWLYHTKGIHGRVQQERFEQQLQRIMNGALEEAKKRRVPNRMPPNQYPPRLKTPETEARRELLCTVQRGLIERYGAYATPMLLDQSIITHYSQTGQLVISKNYAREVVQAMAQELQITL